jgi:phage replication O-like protein O
MSKRAQKPNYTQTPNLLFDDWMQAMGEAELKVVMTIVRHTFGYHLDARRLSLSDLERLTGLSRQAVSDGIEKALARGVIDRAPVGRSFEYWLIVNEVDQSEAADESTQATSDSQQSRPMIVNEVDQSRHALKENNGKENKSKENTPPTIDGDPPSMSDPPAGVGGGGDWPPVPAPPVVSELSPIQALYQQEFGPLTPLVQQFIDETRQDHPDADILAAMHTAVANQARRWSYVMGCLKAPRRHGPRQRPRGDPAADHAAWLRRAESSPYWEEIEH